jgi:hypothetical protein
MQREPSPALALPIAAAWRVLLPLVVVVVLVAPEHGVAADSPRPPGTPAPVREEGVRWLNLTPAQREALSPLERDWPSIEAWRKQKWLAIAARYHSLPPEERTRIQARMTEWARMTPAERGQARLRFEEARHVPATDRSARWQAYQALPPEERAQFAARAAHAASSPAAADGAARPSKSASRDSKEAKSNLVPNPALTQPPRPVAPTLVQAGPGATTTLITRQPTPPAHQQSGMPKIAATPEFVQRSTLLPKRGPQAAAVTSSAAIPPAPVAPVRTLAPVAAKPASSAPR